MTEDLMIFANDSLMSANMSERQETLAEENASKRARREERKCDHSTEEFEESEKLKTAEEKEQTTVEQIHESVKDGTFQAKKTNGQGQCENDQSTVDSGSSVDGGTVSWFWNLAWRLMLRILYWVTRGSKVPSVMWSVMKPIDCDLKGADRTFLNACQKQLGKSVNLTFKSAKVAVHGNAREFDILICPIMDRLGSSVDSAMRKAECAGHHRLVLVLFHHQAPHSALALESDWLLTDHPYNGIGCMVDVVFWQNEGMYYCDSNTRAVDKLVRFIQDSLAE